MALIKRSCIEDIRARVNLVDLVSGYVSLKRSGSSWKGLSPFSNEKTPSFHVNPDKGFFYCFSTSQGGDLFRFLQLKENLSFQEAVETVADRFHIPLEYEEGGMPAEARSLRKELHLIHQVATDYYHQRFLENPPPAPGIQGYWLEKRRFSLELAKSFHIGYAHPSDNQALIDRLMKERISTEALRQCGLFFARDHDNNPRHWRHRFRGRLMIPIRDIQGRLVAFTARQLPETPEDDPARDAKYVNSPETPVFKKSDLLFNLDHARTHLRDDTPAVLVEGQLDALRCVEQGIPTAVAPQGTAITETQLLQLRRLTGKIDCLLDGDEAGQRAALRILPMCLKLGLEIRFLLLPKGSDPDDLLLREGTEGLEHLRRDALDAMAFAVQTLIPAKATPRDRTLGLQRIFEMLLEGESEVMRHDYLQQVGRLAGVERLALEQDFERFARSRATPPPRQPESGPSPAPSPESLNSPEKLTTAESDLLFILLHQAELAGPIARLIDPAWINADSIHGTLLRRLLAEIIENGGDLPTHWDDLLESEPERNTLYAMLGTPGVMDDPEDLRKKVNICIKRLYTQHHDSTRHSLEQQLFNTTDLDIQRKLQQQRITLRNELRAFNQNPPQLTFD